MNTGTHVPVASCNGAATRPPSTDPIPCAMYKNPYFVVASFAPNVSVSVDGNSENISPQPKNTTPDINANSSALSRTPNISSTATASSENAISMVFSRPIRSDTKPKKGRVRPLVIRSNVRANGSAAMPKIVTSAIPKLRVNGANCEITIRPPVDIIVIMTNSSQNTGVRSIMPGETPAATETEAAGSTASGMMLR